MKNHVNKVAICRTVLLIMVFAVAFIFGYMAVAYNEKCLKNGGHIVKIPSGYMGRLYSKCSVKI